MRRILLPFAAVLLGCGSFFAAQVETKPGTTPSPKSQSPSASAKPAASPAAASPAPASPAATAELPKYRPALLGTGPTSVINRIDSVGLIQNGQKDATLSFCCSVSKEGDIANVWTYRGTPGYELLEKELVKRLDQTKFIPAVYNHHPVYVLFYGTVTFKIVDGKPRLRIFANQETEELKKESDFIGPQPFAGADSKFEGLHYPNDSLTTVLSGIVELAMKVDADGNMKDLRVASESPPLAGFARAAAEDFRVARFIPAFRDGKPVECSITLPVYYEP
jgi:TonB family protein